MAIINDKEHNVRFNIKEETYTKVVQVQGLFSLKEKRRVSIADTYDRLLNRGATEVLKSVR